MIAISNQYGWSKNPKSTVVKIKIGDLKEITPETPHLVASCKSNFELIGEVNSKAHVENTFYLQKRPNKQNLPLYESNHQNE